LYCVLKKKKLAHTRQQENKRQSLKTMPRLFWHAPDDTIAHCHATLFSAVCFPAEHMSKVFFLHRMFSFSEHGKGPDLCRVFLAMHNDPALCRVFLALHTATDLCRRWSGGILNLDGGLPPSLLYAFFAFQNS
jgi:hypothetical protein